MKREDLKAYDGESIYRVLEYTPHNADELHLEECFSNKSEFKFYEKEEADRVMDAMERRIKDLESDLETMEVSYEALIKNAVNVAKDTELRLRYRINELENQCVKYQAELMNNDPALHSSCADYNKLKCLALHLFVSYSHQKYELLRRLRYVLPPSKITEKSIRNADRWHRIYERCNEAYRKAKKELRYGKDN